MISLLRSSFSSSERRAVSIAAEGVSVYQWEGGTVTNVLAFDPDDSGLAQFDRYLREMPKQPVYLLVDIVEEEYRQETIPHVFGTDQRAFIERKQAWLFRGTPYCHVIHQGREKTGRRDDRVLFTAITNAEIVVPWVRLCLQNKVPVAGIYSLPIVSGALLDRMRLPARDLLLVTAQSASGLRQSFFRDGQLIISRLARMPRLGSAPFAPQLLTELERFARYLKNVNALGEATLDIVVITHGEVLEQLEARCRNSELTRYHLLDVAGVAARLGIQGVLTTPYSDLIFAHLLLTNTPRNQYAQREDRHFFTLFRARQAMLAASAMSLIGGSMWAGFNLWQGDLLRRNAVANEQKAVHYQQRFEIAKRRLPPTAVPPAQIRAAVQIVDTLVRHRSEPAALLATLGGTLAGFPLLQLSELRWVATGKPEQALTEGSGTDPAGGADGPGSLNPSADGYYQVALVNGVINELDDNVREALAQVNRLAEALRTRPEVRTVQVVKLPVDIGPEARLVGGTELPMTAGGAAFSIRVVFGVAHEVG